jgi:exodeoxyribonuclease V alpha subunit
MAGDDASGAEEWLADSGLFPAGDDRIARLYRGDGIHSAMLVLDLLTIRDLLGHAGEAARTSPGAHALLVAMFLALREGNLSLRLEEGAIAARLETYLPGDMARGFAADAIGAVDHLEGLIVDGGESGPLVGGRYRPIVRAGIDGGHTRRGTGRLYFHRYFVAEREIRERLAERRRATVAIDSEAARAALEAVVSGNPQMNGASARVLNENQRRAVAMGMARKLTVVSGGPGTGKTSIVLALLRCLCRLGVPSERMVLAAPTGRAAQRLAASVREGLGSLKNPATTEEAALATLAGTTLHRLLGFSANRGTFYRNADNPIDADVVVVDECSMADATIMAALLDALPESARLVLLGDKDQLPSVEAGAVLAGLLPDGVLGAGDKSVEAVLADGAASGGPAAFDGIVVLTTNYRSERRIQEVAAAINGGDVGIVDRLERAMTIEEALAGHDAVVLVEGGNDGRDLDVMLRAWERKAAEGLGGESAAKLLAELAVHLVDEPAARKAAGRALRRLDRFRILTVTRVGWGGSLDVNARLSAMARGAARARGIGAVEQFAGLPVMATVNDHARGIFNGDVGLCARDRDGNLVVWMDSSSVAADGPAGLAPQSIPGMEAAFAVTVHKGQGSEYENVLLLFPPDVGGVGDAGGVGHRLLTRQIVYTAVTRARRRVVIRAKAEALRAAIGRPMLRDSPSLWG